MANYIIKLKRGKAESWALQNPVLQPGEPGFELDTGRLKIGNGVSSWIDLDYIDTDENVFVTKEELQEAIENITISEEVLLNYATKEELDELYESMIPLSEEEILQICK